MGQLDWNRFNRLGGSPNTNFETICRSIVRIQFGGFGRLEGRRNQPGVEFVLRLDRASPTLGEPPRVWGWQCKVHEPGANGQLLSSAKKDITDSLSKTSKHVKGITDWVLWTPYTLASADQEWFGSLTTPYQLHLWTGDDVETLLSGAAVHLRQTYFGEFVLEPESLQKMWEVAIRPIAERYFEPVHQIVDPEREIGRMLLHPQSWEHLKQTADDLAGHNEKLDRVLSTVPSPDSSFVGRLMEQTVQWAKFSQDLYDALVAGRATTALLLAESPPEVPDEKARSCARRLRRVNSPGALSAQNALAGIFAASKLVKDLGQVVKVGIVAVVGEAGAGKTQLAAQVTKRTTTRPAGVFFQGKSLRRDGDLDSLARGFKPEGIPFPSFEMLIQALDAAGQRADCRIPVIIDGLNEAEDPHLWRDALASLEVWIKEYPHVLVILTLRTGGRHSTTRYRDRDSEIASRETFARISLPDTVQRLELDGFDEDTESAIAKYFEYYMIDSRREAIPAEFFNHPLTLKIFCQVLNPARKERVAIGNFPTAIFPLFGRFLAGVAERISRTPNPGFRYTEEQVLVALHQYGLLLWESNSREVPEEMFNIKTGNGQREWRDSLVNHLVQEGVLLRDPGVGVGKYLLSPVYDLLGGYLVAEALIAKALESPATNLFTTDAFVQAMTGDATHELASDIFRSLVTILPGSKIRNQLWQTVAPQLKKAALLRTITVEPQLIDQDTKEALFQALQESPEDQKRAFGYLRSVRGSVDHPFNARFFSRLLQSLSVSERDLTWTEWLRQKDEGDLIGELKRVEEKWKLSASTDAHDRLVATWLAWMLTTTDHYLRDRVTRALYWYARVDFTSLADECLASLGWNDPYIPERLLAACYGALMAKFGVFDDQFLRDHLSPFARRLFDLEFASGSEVSTPHILIHEYSLRICELAVLIDKSIFSSEEKTHLEPPYLGMRRRKWGVAVQEGEEWSSYRGPFRMDFENYTIGHLVRDRGNYHYKHPEYQEVRSKILWRVQDLGWSAEKFGKLDTDIPSGQEYRRIGSDGRKVDRYGKKYSWIAYHEMAGEREFLGLIDSWGERTSEVDIDPSFPSHIEKGSPLAFDLLGANEGDLFRWIQSGPRPEVLSELVVRDTIDGTVWVVLDALKSSQNEDSGRSSFVFIRSFLVNRSDVDRVRDALDNGTLVLDQLPEVPSVTYTFAGEIPWCETYPDFSEQSLHVRTGEMIARSYERPNIRFIFEGQDVEAEEENRPEIIQHFEAETFEIPCRVPVCSFGWEGHQSATYEGVRGKSLCRSISQDLGLRVSPQSLDMVNATGERVVRSVESEDRDFHNSQDLVYISKTALDSYLRSKDLALVWIVWGERNCTQKYFDKFDEEESRTNPRYAKFYDLYRYEDAGE